MGQSRMDYPEKLATLGTQDTGRRQTKQKTHHRKLKRRVTWTAPKTQHKKLKRRATWTTPKTRVVPNCSQRENITLTLL